MIAKLTPQKDELVSREVPISGIATKLPKASYRLTDILLLPNLYPSLLFLASAASYKSKHQKMRWQRNPYFCKHDLTITQDTSHNLILNKSINVPLYMSYCYSQTLESLVNQEDLDSHIERMCFNPVKLVCILNTFTGTELNYLLVCYESKLLDTDDKLSIWMHTRSLTWVSYNVHQTWLRKTSHVSKTELKRPPCILTPTWMRKTGLSKLGGNWKLQRSLKTNSTQQSLSSSLPF